MTAERPASATVVGEYATEESLTREPDLAAEEFPYTTSEARALAEAFEHVRARARGLAAAPESWLPGRGDQLAGVLNVALGPDADRAAITRFKESLVDLQAFIPDDDAEAAQRAHGGRTRDEADRRRGEAGLKAVLEGQAAAISWLRDDDRVVGTRNALRPLNGVVVGDAERALAAVDRYKEAQALAFVSMFVAPVAVIVGGVIGILLLGITGIGVALAVVLAAAYVFPLGPMIGSGIGEISSRARRAATRIPGNRPASVTVALVEGMTVVMVFLVPAAIGFAAIAAGVSIDAALNG